MNSKRSQVLGYTRWYGRLEFLHIKIYLQFLMCYSHELLNSSEFVYIRQCQHVKAVDCGAETYVITGSPAGLSLVNGVRRSSAHT